MEYLVGVLVAMGSNPDKLVMNVLILFFLSKPFYFLFFWVWVMCCKVLFYFLAATTRKIGNVESFRSFKSYIDEGLSCSFLILLNMVWVD